MGTSDYLKLLMKKERKGNLKTKPYMKIGRRKGSTD